MESSRAADIPNSDKPGDTSRVHTDGGAFVAGGVNTGGGAFIGRDQYIVYLQTPVVGPEEAQDIEDLPPDPGEPPFQGLQYFEEKDADRFFGREQVTARIIARLHRTRFLAVIGASGSGKSSVIRAGVIPALRRGKRLEDGGMPPTDSAKWLMRTFTPSSHPIDALAANLTPGSAPLSTTAQLKEDLLHNPKALTTAARRLLADNQSRHLLLFVDQFEEVFTLCRSVDEREAFLGNLLTVSDEQEGGQVTVLIALRADYYAQVAQHDGLRDAVAQHQEFIGAMSREELVRAIDRPLAQGNWKIQKGLIEVILDDIGYEPGALPLLSHALLETWNNRRGRTLTLSGYTEAGGVQGAVAKTAEAVFQRLPEEQQPVAQLIFLRMAEVGEASQDTRRRAAFSELITRSTDDLVINAVIKILTDARLVITDTVQPGDTRVVEVAHEALIREWPRLREWLEKDRQGLILHQHLTEATAEWIKLERDPDYLYRGTRLQQASTWAQVHLESISLHEQEFLDESHRQAEEEAKQARRLARAKRQQRIFLAVTGVLLVAVAYLAYTYFFTQESAVMDGLYNIAIAEIGGGSDGTAGSGVSEASNLPITEYLFTGLSQSLGGNPNIQIWRDSPDLKAKNVRIGPVDGRTPEERQAAVVSLAERLHADMVIFESGGSEVDGNQVHLAFYLAPRLDANDEDVQGTFELGCTVSQRPAGEAQHTEASSCVNGLAWIALGLSEAHLGRSLEALEAFQSAGKYMPESALLWFLTGREYLFLVEREAVLDFASDEFEAQAERAFTRSAQLDPQYARAYIGLGSTSLKQARQLVESYAEGKGNFSTLDQANLLIDKSLAAYQQALDLSINPGAEGLPLDSVSRLGLGNGQRLKGEVLQKQGLHDQALEQIDQSIATLGLTIEPLKQAGQQRYLTQAYEYLGTAYQWQAYTYLVNQNYELGIPAYEQALDYYNLCIAQGESTQDLVIRNEIVIGICQPNRDSIQQELDNLKGAQG